MEFSGKTAIVTGAGKGIGRAIVMDLARQGAKLVICDINEEWIKSVESEIRAFNPNVISCVFDISKEDEVNKMVSTAKETFGRVDILINNAGIYLSDMGPFAESKSDSWKKKTEVNIYGTMYATRAVLPDMVGQGYGRIINIGSVAGVYGNANMVDYSMTKGAIISFTQALAKEVAEYGVTVNTVSPGNIDVDGAPLPSYSFMNRSGTPEELANAVVFLASDKASFISGQNYIVDGCRKKM